MKSTALKRCADCGVERRWLHRHHVEARSEGGSDDSSNLVELCVNCHEDRHEGRVGGSLGHSPEAQAKRGASMREVWKDPEYRKRRNASASEAWDTKRDRQAFREKMKAHWAEPGYRENIARKVSETKRRNRQ